MGSINQGNRSAGRRGGDPLATALRREAARSRPDYSEQLHRRVIAAIHRDAASPLPTYDDHSAVDELEDLWKPPRRRRLGPALAVLCSTAAATILLVLLGAMIQQLPTNQRAAHREQAPPPTNEEALAALEDVISSTARTPSRMGQDVQEAILQKPGLMFWGGVDNATGAFAEQLPWSVIRKHRTGQASPGDSPRIDRATRAGS